MPNLPPPEGLPVGPLVSLEIQSVEQGRLGSFVLLRLGFWPHWSQSLPCSAVSLNYGVILLPSAGSFWQAHARPIIRKVEIATCRVAVSLKQEKIRISLTTSMSIHKLAPPSPDPPGSSSDPLRLTYVHLLPESPHCDLGPLPVSSLDAPQVTLFHMLVF